MNASVLCTVCLPRSHTFNMFFWPVSTDAHPVTRDSVQRRMPAQTSEFHFFVPRCAFRGKGYYSLGHLADSLEGRVTQWVISLWMIYVMRTRDRPAVVNEQRVPRSLLWVEEKLNSRGILCGFHFVLHMNDDLFARPKASAPKKEQNTALSFTEWFRIFCTGVSPIETHAFLSKRGTSISQAIRQEWCELFDVTYELWPEVAVHITQLKDPSVYNPLHLEGAFDPMHVFSPSVALNSSRRYGYDGEGYAEGRQVSPLHPTNAYLIHASQFTPQFVREHWLPVEESASVLSTVTQTTMPVESFEVAMSLYLATCRDEERDIDRLFLLACARRAILFWDKGDVALSAPPALLSFAPTDTFRYDTSVGCAVLSAFCDGLQVCSDDPHSRTVAMSLTMAAMSTERTVVAFNEAPKNTSSIDIEALDAVMNKLFSQSPLCTEEEYPLVKKTHNGQLLAIVEEGSPPLPPHCLRHDIIGTELLAPRSDASLCVTRKTYEYKQWAGHAQEMCKKLDFLHRCDITQPMNTRLANVLYDVYVKVLIEAGWSKRDAKDSHKRHAVLQAATAASEMQARFFVAEMGLTGLQQTEAVGADLLLDMQAFRVVDVEVAAMSISLRRSEAVESLVADVLDNLCESDSTGTPPFRRSSEVHFTAPSEASLVNANRYIVLCIQVLTRDIFILLQKGGYEVDRMSISRVLAKGIHEDFFKIMSGGYFRVSTTWLATRQTSALTGVLTRTFASANVAATLVLPNMVSGQCDIVSIDPAAARKQRVLEYYTRRWSTPEEEVQQWVTNRLVTHGGLDFTEAFVFTVERFLLRLSVDADRTKEIDRRMNNDSMKAFYLSRLEQARRAVVETMAAELSPEVCATVLARIAHAVSVADDVMDTRMCEQTQVLLQSFATIAIPTVHDHELSKLARVKNHSYRNQNRVAAVDYDPATIGMGKWIDLGAPFIDHVYVAHIKRSCPWFRGDAHTHYAFPATRRRIVHIYCKLVGVLDTLGKRLADVQWVNAIPVGAIRWACDGEAGSAIDKRLLSIPPVLEMAASTARELFGAMERASCFTVRPCSIEWQAQYLKERVHRGTPTNKRVAVKMIMSCVATPSVKLSRRETVAAFLRREVYGALCAYLNHKRKMKQRAESGGRSVKRRS